MPTSLAPYDGPIGNENDKALRYSRLYSSHVNKNHNLLTTWTSIRTLNTMKII